VDEHDGGHVLWIWRMVVLRRVGVMHFILVINLYIVSSPYLLVFGKDHAIHYTGSNEVASGAGEA